MDDPWFLWVAQQILKDPLDFYGFDVNWYGWPQSMTQLANHPPGFSFLLAGIAFVFGDREWAFHLALLVPAAAFGWGTWRLAGRMCSLRWLAALVAVASPAFLVSATNIMPDVTLAALYVWAVTLWVEATEQENHRTLLWASLLITAACMTKFFGASLIPLLLVYSWIHRRRLGPWALYLAIPVVALVLYHWATSLLYGHSLFGDVFSNLEKYFSKSYAPLGRMVVGLSFLGGGLFGILFFLPCLWSPRRWVTWGIFFLMSAVILVLLPVPGSGYVWAGSTLQWSFAVQYAMFVTGGTHVTVLMLDDLKNRRDPHSWLLFFWLGGTFFFAALLNWSVTVRGFLPLIPAAGILMARRLDSMGEDRRRRMGRAGWALAPALGIALAVAWADYTLAGSNKTFVSDHAERLRTRTGKTLWFQGHWGFQYYMQKAGARPLHLRQDQTQPGDVIVNPQYNTNVYPLVPDKTRLHEIIYEGVFPWLGSHNSLTGAGFYSSLYGPLPFVFGGVPPSRFDVYTVMVPGENTVPE